MRYLSLFSGIEAATVAWKPLGWHCVAVAEIEPFPCAVLAHHYPNVPNLGDVTKITEAQVAALGPIDLVVFGSPCQDLSVVGQRKGFLDEHGNATRSGLFFAAIDIVGWARKHCGCRFALWENVPGAFSSNKGRDFAAVVEQMAGLDAVPVPPKGWGTEGVALGSNGLLEWSTLDAQWFGVAQRRRRVFALADFGNWANRPPILLEPEGLRGNSPPRRETEKATAGNTGAGATDSEQPYVVANTLTQYKTCISEQEQPRAAALSVCEHRFGITLDTIAPTLVCGGGKPGQGYSAALVATQVRKLTPVECERLQGFPDNYTNIPWRGKPVSPDSARYKALGNSMAVPVMRWIGMQLQKAV